MPPVLNIKATALPAGKVMAQPDVAPVLLHATLRTSGKLRTLEANRKS